MTNKQAKFARVVPPRDKNVQVRLTEDEHAKLMEYARKEESNAVRVIRRLLRDAGII